jgi:hypothetical protein
MQFSSKFGVLSFISHFNLLAWKTRYGNPFIYCGAQDVLVCRVEHQLHLDFVVHDLNCCFCLVQSLG